MPKKGYWQAWQSEADGLWYWHLRSMNHEIVAHGEGYGSRQSCHRGIEAVEAILEGRTDLGLEWIADPNAA